MKEYGKGDPSIFHPFKSGSGIFGRTLKLSPDESHFILNKGQSNLIYLDIDTKETFQLKKELWGNFYDHVVMEDHRVGVLPTNGCLSVYRYKPEFRSSSLICKLRIPRFFKRDELWFSLHYDSNSGCFIAHSKKMNTHLASRIAIVKLKNLEMEFKKYIDIYDESLGVFQAFKSYDFWAGNLVFLGLSFGRGKSQVRVYKTDEEEELKEMEELRRVVSAVDPVSIVKLGTDEFFSCDARGRLIQLNFE